MTNLSRGGVTLGDEDRPGWNGYGLGGRARHRLAVSFVVDPGDYHLERIRVGDIVEIRTGPLGGIAALRRKVVIR